MKLTGVQIQRIQQVFLDAFYDYNELARMVRVVLDQNLHEIVERRALEEVVFQLVEWSDRHDNVEELIRGAYQFRTGNLELEALNQEIEQWDTLRPAQASKADPLSGRAAEQATTSSLLDQTLDAQAPLPPSQITIEEAPSVQLSPQERQLLRIALAYYARDVLASTPAHALQKVIVEHKFGAGFSGAVVLLMDPGPGRAPVVAKIGPFDDLQQEYEGYQRLIRVAAPNIAASVLSAPWSARDGSGMGILFYIYGSAPRQLPHSLLDYYRQAGGEKAALVLHNLLLEQGRELWGNTRKERFWLVQEYDRLLPVHLEVRLTQQGEPTTVFEAGQVDDSELRRLVPGDQMRLRGFTLVKFVNVPARGAEPAQTRILLQAPPPPGKVSGELRVLLIQTEPAPVAPSEIIPQVDVQVYATRLGRLRAIAEESLPAFQADAPFFQMQTEALPNPLRGLDELLDSRAEANWSTIHGDLNLENILIDPPSGFARLIDFAETRHGPTLFDIHRLIVQVVTRLLARAVGADPMLGPESLSYLMHELHNDSPALESPVPILQELYVVLRTLRQISAHYVDQYDGWRFYYNGLRIAFIGALRFAELDAAARSLVLVGAAKATELADTPLPAGNERVPAPGVSPYKGLMPFEQQDAALFYGRDALTARLINQLALRHCVVLVGASGSGKSSLVRAGLIPTFLRASSVEGEAPVARQAIALTPTDQPLLRLAQALTAGEEGADATALRNNMFASPTGLYRYIQEQLPPTDPAVATAKRQLLLLVDQLEELFALCRDEAERVAFIDNLLRASQGEDGDFSSDKERPQETSTPVRTLVVCTLRADFYTRFLRFEQLRTVLENNQIIVPAMTMAEMNEAITCPAQTPYSAWYFESGLIEQMIGDVGAEPGALPLLSHALLETWRRRGGRTLTLAGYQAAGRVQGAIAQTADALYEKLPPAEQALTKHIFLALTELGEGAADTRRRVLHSDLVQGEQAKVLEVLIERLAQRRLITLSHEHVEVAHEALIRRWPRLQGWLEEDREGLRIERRLREAARQWENSARDPDLLYRGALLIQSLEWARLHHRNLSASVREYLAFSETTLAQAEWHRGDLSYARAHLEEAVEIAPHLPHSHFALFNFLVESEQLDDAMTVYRSLLEQLGTRYSLLPEEYQVEELLGKSRLGLIFKAHQAKPQVSVTIALTPTVPEIAPGQLAELRTHYLSIDSQYISRFLNINRFGERYFAVAEFVEGELLESYLDRQETIEPHTAFIMLDQIAQGLADGHLQELPHLRLNPATILVTSKGAVLIHYGEERMAEALLPEKTGIRKMIQEQYGAPEQFTGAPTGLASDIYAMGALINRFFATQAQSRAVVTSRASTQAELADALSILISHASALDPTKRYPTIGVLRAELLRVASAAGLSKDLVLGTWLLGWFTRCVAWVRSAGVRIFFVLLVILAAFAQLWSNIPSLLPITRAILALAFTVYPASLLFAWQTRDIARSTGHASLVLHGSGMGAILGLLSLLWTIQNSAVDWVPVNFDLRLLPPHTFPIFIVIATVVTLIIVLFGAYAVRLSGQLARQARGSYHTGFYSAFVVLCLLLLLHTLSMWYLSPDAMFNFSLLPPVNR